MYSISSLVFSNFVLRLPNDSKMLWISFPCFLLINLKISFWEYSFIMNKHNQMPTDMFNKQDVNAYLTAYVTA